MHFGDLPWTDVQGAKCKLSRLRCDYDVEGYHADATHTDDVFRMKRAHTPSNTHTAAHFMTGVLNQGDSSDECASTLASVYLSTSSILVRSHIVKRAVLRSSPCCRLSSMQVMSGKDAAQRDYDIIFFF